MSVRRSRVATPPPKTKETQVFKPVLSPRPENQSSPAKSSYQAECFTPRSTIKRSPPPPQSRKGRPPSSVPPTSTSNSSDEDSKSAYELGEGSGVRVIQDDCFTPRRSLQRSPGTKSRTESGTKSRTEQKASSKDKENGSSPELLVKKTRKDSKTPAIKAKQRATTRPQNDLVDAAPPAQRWEIPRTPDALPTTSCVHTAQLESIVEEKPSQRESSSSPDTNSCRVKLDFQTQDEPCEDQSPPTKACSPSPPIKIAQRLNFSPRITSPKCITNHPLHTSRTARRLKSPSPPIPMARDVSASGLAGLVCTEEDLAYLQRRKHLKQYEQLQSEMAHVGKALKSAAEHKEQLQHEAVKINTDVERMKNQYRETVTVIQELIYSPSQTAVINPSALPQPPPPPHGVSLDTAQEEAIEAVQATPELTQSKVTKLKRVNQLKGVQVERVDRELRSKLTKVDQERDQVQQQITRKEVENRELQARLHSTKKEQTVWGHKVQQVTGDCTSVQDQVVLLETQLARIQLGSSDSTQQGGDEQKRAEERLKRIIRRCELYVKREKMLKELGV